MAIDLQKLTLRRLLDTQSNDLYSKLLNQYFTGINSVLYDKIKSFYKANTRLPSTDEILTLRKDAGLQEYIENQICAEDNHNEQIADEFLVAQLQDYYIRDETIHFMDKFIDQMDNMEKVEVVDKFQNHLLHLNQAIPHDDELYDVAELEFFPSEDDFKIYPSGLSNEFDSVNGGFATQELVMLGGRRGSGKSIISLNLALNRFLQGNTVAFFTIEMRYKEVYDRVLSIISGVPFLDIFRNQLTDSQKIQMAKSKFENFYKPSDKITEMINELGYTKDFKNFEKRVKIERPELKDNRLFMIDDESLTLNRIDHYCNMFSSKYPNYNMAVVDYVNIIKHDDQKDWKTQITIADNLKSLSRKYDLTMISPYQIDASGEARFAKGILDAADRSFNFFPPPEDADRELESKISIHTTKMRNGKHMSFDVLMDWSCVKINPNSSELISEKPHNAVKFGTDKQEGAKDL
jgi:replicative DNA helicase|tara:strand:- start:2861 stop:4249 length:1389 start_codon:yes stop_codon:yes gene_type:complete